MLRAVATKRVSGAIRVDCGSWRMVFWPEGGDTQCVYVDGIGYVEFADMPRCVRRACFKAMRRLVPGRSKRLLYGTGC